LIGINNYKYYDLDNFNSITYDDGGASFTEFIQTRTINLGTNKLKRLHTLRLNGLHSRSTTTVSIQWSDDDGQTWSTARTVDLSSDNPELHNCGIFVNRKFRITHSGTTSLDLYDMQLHYTELRS